MQRTISFVSKFIILVWCFTNSIYAIAQQWQLEKSLEQTQVFSRDNIQAQSHLTYKEILARTQVKATPMALLNLLNDIKRAPLWIDNCLRIEILSSQDENTKIVQSTFSAPWPLLKRDMVTKSTTKFTNNGIIIEISDLGDEYPVPERTVRMAKIQGKWSITSLDEGLLEIRYQGSGNPAGNIPVWLANKVLINSTFETFINLSNIISDEIYQTTEITP